MSRLNLVGLSSLEQLRLNHNQLETLEPGWIQSCPRLVFLLLANNNLKLLDSSVFSDSLRDLNLSGNLLHQVPDLSTALRLQTLSLASNPLDSFSFCSLNFLSRLKDLNISETGLTRVQPCQDTLRSLEGLDISANYLSLPTAELLALPNLRRISAGQRNISVLSRASFVGLDSLRSIEVSNSPELTRLEPGVFAGLEYLETVVIRSCPRLESLPVGLVVGGDTSLTVSMGGNGLRRLEPGSLPWERVHALDLGGNPLHCDCSVGWLLPLLERFNSSAVCSTPLQYATINLEQLDKEQFQCTALGPIQEQN